MNVVGRLSVCVKGYRNENEIYGMDGSVWGTASGRDTREHRGRVGDEDVSLLRSGRHVVRVD